MLQLGYTSVTSGLLHYEFMIWFDFKPASVKSLNRKKTMP